MPRIVCRKAFVLVHPDGELERLDTPEQLQGALDLCEQSSEYEIDQRDLVEILP